MLYYQIALTNVPFDNSYKNVIHFEDRSEQETFFNVSSLFSSSTPKVNFNVGSLYATNVSYDGVPTDSINELLSKNYCIIKDNSPNKTLNYYYYFVTEARQDCENRILLSLELDIFQTYYIDITFGDCLINKANLNRFIEKTGDSTKVLFDGTTTSKLFEREDIQNVAKRMTKRTAVSLYKDNVVGNWFNDNIQNWVYIYVAPYTTAERTTGTLGVNTLTKSEAVSNTLTFADITAGTGSTSCSPIPIRISGEAGRLPSGFSVFCYPIYKRSYKILFKNSNIKGGLDGTTQYDVVWGDTSQSSATYDYQTVLERFQKSNNGASYIQSVKVSTMPPFDPNNLPTTLPISTSDENLVYNLSDANVVSTGSSHFLINPFIQSSGSANGVGIYGLSYDNGLNSRLYFGISEIEFQTNEINQSVYTVSKDYEFLKSSIVGADKDVKFNPKLLSTDYFELKISDAGEDGFVYDYQKLHAKSFYVKYSESFTPDIAKKYIRIDTQTNAGLYQGDNDKNLVGFVNSNDNSLVLSTTQYQQMLASNKNYFLQNSVNRSADVGKSVTGILGGIAGGFISGGIGGAIVGGIGGAIKTGINYEQSRIQEKLTQDNMISAPASIRGAQGNVIFDNMFSKNGIIVEEWDILDNEKEMINDYMCMFGYTYNRIDNIKNVDNIRKYYNYVRADVEVISGTTTNVSEKVHQKFKEQFAKGVRFWNVVNGEVNFNYDKENYEKWLEE